MLGSIVNENDVRALVWGGAVLGGGGGGSPQLGLDTGRAAVRLGEPRIAQLEEMKGMQGQLVMLSAVGAPAAEGRLRPLAFVRAVQVLRERMDRPLIGFMANECGGLAVTSALLPSAHFGLPLVDVAANGRAYPVSAMAHMDLDREPGYCFRAAVCGGSSADDSWVELYVEGTPHSTAQITRSASVVAGGLVAVARNPVSPEYARTGGAPGSLGLAARIGRRMLGAEPEGPEAMIQSAARAAVGTIALRGRVREIELDTSGGFDAGRARVDDAEITFFNEWMTLERDGHRLATFPDLITSFNSREGLPVSTAELREDMEVAMLVVPRAQLPLGVGMRRPEAYRELERATGRDIRSHVFDPDGRWIEGPRHV